jgi:antitoxin HicB
MSKKHIGSSIDDFLKEEGIFEEAQTQAVKEVVAWQLAEAMRKRKSPKTRWQRCSRRAAPKLTVSFDPQNDITLGSLQRAAAIVGRRVTIKLV